jgi:hypothetical protein
MGPDHCTVSAKVRESLQYMCLSVSLEHIRRSISSLKRFTTHALLARATRFRSLQVLTLVVPVGLSFDSKRVKFKVHAMLLCSG